MIWGASCNRLFYVGAAFDNGKADIIKAVLLRKCLHSKMVSASRGRKKTSHGSTNLWNFIVIGLLECWLNKYFTHEFYWWRPGPSYKSLRKHRWHTGSLKVGVKSFLKALECQAFTTVSLTCTTGQIFWCHIIGAITKLVARYRRSHRKADQNMVEVAPRHWEEENSGLPMLVRGQE